LHTLRTKNKLKQQKQSADTLCEWAGGTCQVVSGQNLSSQSPTDWTTNTRQFCTHGIM